MKLLSLVLMILGIIAASIYNPNNFNCQVLECYLVVALAVAAIKTQLVYITKKPQKAIFTSKIRRLIKQSKENLFSFIIQVGRLDNDVG